MEAEERRTSTGLVSVIIPCYNQAHFLGEAIESVLAQSYPNFEIVVVDDGSPDDTSEVAARYPGVRCIGQENQGLAGARNTGIRESKGEYLVFLDADDRLLPEALEVGVKNLRARPECAFVSGLHQEIAADGSFIRGLLSSHMERDHYVELLRGNYVGMHAAVMYRRSVFKTVGGFDTSYKASEDYDLYLRIARRRPVCGHDRVVAEYRLYETNITHTNPALMLTSSLEALRSQRAYIKGNRRYEEAYKIGVRFWQNLYGVPLAYKVLTQLSERKWKRAIGDLLVLVRYYPGVFFRAWRKLLKVLLQLLRSLRVM